MPVNPEGFIIRKISEFLLWNMDVFLSSYWIEALMGETEEYIVLF